jgi:ABC-2 type transport system ATP-binding protein
MKDETVIDVVNITKSFKLPHESQNTIKGILINLNKRGYEKQVVLKNMSLQVYKSDFLGILGRNGSGKSTLLKILSGIYYPNEGSVNIKGKLTPFIELGVGFNPELSGRDNVYLNGALLGFSRTEMMAMYDDIVAFAELERFMDQKLKNYSSGMQVRLAFSIAIRADTDILILDEVLAVGDEAFQRKCYDYFYELKERGKTVILVTHDMSAVQRFCTRAIVLAEGKIIYNGDTESAAHIYRSLNLKSTEHSLNIHNKRQAEKNKRAKKTSFLGVKMLDEKSISKVLYGPHQKIVIEVEVKIDQAIKKPALQVWFSNPGGLPINRLGIDNRHLKKYLKDTTETTLKISWVIDGIFNDGKYVVSVELDDEKTNDKLEVIENSAEFIVTGWDAANVLVHPNQTYDIKVL